MLKKKNPKSDNEDESSNPADESSNSMNKFKKTRSLAKCSYFGKGFHSQKKCFKKNIEIIAQFFEKHNIDVPDELEKLVESSEHCHNAQSQGNINYALSSRVK